MTRRFRTSPGWGTAGREEGATRGEQGAAARVCAAVTAVAWLLCLASPGARRRTRTRRPSRISTAQQVDVNTDPPQNIDSGKTMDSYKRFLDLNAGDAALRAEALRRLGDLNLESSESERIERELVTNEGLRVRRPSTCIRRF